ncbi:MAG: DUF493 family protein [Halobacteriovoraceae bacterium]|nr:DUF493 family protein [Halobacteriovoraceae bacterium]
MSDANYSRLKQLLENQNTWPSKYVFKFVVPSQGLSDIKDLLPDHDLMERPSRTGKYVAITFTNEFQNSEEIINVYKKVSNIEGIIQL